MNESVAQAAPQGNANNLELNKGDNFIFGVDVSGSMATSDCPGNTTRIEYLKEKVIQFANEASKWDTDGIDVISFGHKITPYNNVTAEKAKEIITKFAANEGSTDTAGLIQKAYDMHKAGKYEQTVLFVATDGEPNDRSAVKKVIEAITHDVKDEREFNIAFLTVGNIAPDLRNFLTALDDDLKGAKYDIVDVKALEEVDFMSAFLGALND
jgi:Mg-chelatase subunit ChlD